MLKSIRPTFSITNHILKRTVYSEKCCTPGCFPNDPCDPGTQITILPNGIRVATEYKPTPLSCMSLFIEAGPRFETAYNNGITHFLEHMAYKGCCGLSRQDLEDSFLAMGARMTAKTRRDIQKFTGIFPSEYAADVFDKLAGIITDLELNLDEIEATKYNICMEMVDEENDPRSVTFDYLHQTAFQGTSLAQSVIGTSKNVARFDRCFAINFLGQHYQPYKLCLVTSGKVKHDDVVSFACKRLSHLSGDPCCESDEGPSRFTGSQVVYRNDDMPFAHVAIAFEAPGYTSPDYLKYLLASNIMGKWHKSQGGGLGNASYVARAAACHDMCESFESFYIPYRDIGLWGVYFVAKSLKIEDMVQNIQHQWMHLCVTTQFTDMERAKNTLKLQFAREVTGVVNSCNDIGTQVLYKCTRQSLEDKFYGLSKIKVGELRDCAEKMLYDRCPAVAAVGPTEALPDYNRIRANQYWLRL